MRLRRSTEKNTPGSTDVDHDLLLEQVRAHLPTVITTRQDLERQLDELQTRLDQLDGIAERLAVLGLYAEGASVLEHQAMLGGQKHLLVQQCENTLAIETRLRSAEQHLLRGGESQAEGLHDQRDFESVLALHMHDIDENHERIKKAL